VYISHSFQNHEELAEVYLKVEVENSQSSLQLTKLTRLTENSKKLNRTVVVMHWVEQCPKKRLDC
jgi:hypothetical protein